MAEAYDPASLTQGVSPMNTTTRLSGWAGWLSLRKAPRSGAFGPASPGGRSRTRPAFRPRLYLEPLEDRWVLSPVVLDRDLAVRTVVGGLTQATSMAFLGANDF